MAKGCKCGGSQNTGFGSCEANFGVPVGMILTSMIADDGNANYIDLTTDLTDAIILAKVNNVDKTKRWFPFLQNTNDVKIEVADAETTTGTFGQVFTGLGKGSESVSFEYVGKGKGFAADLNKAYQCSKNMGVYYVDHLNQIMGSISADGTKLYPFSIANGTFSAKPSFGGTARGEYVTIKFSLDIFNDDASARILTDVQVVISRYNGLIDVVGVFSSLTTTGFTVTLTKKGASAISDKLTGLVADDMALKTNTGTTVTISGVTEASDGVYNVTFATNATPKYLTITKNGYDFGDVSETLIATS